MHDIKVLNNKCKMGGGDVGSQWFVRRRTRSLVGLKPTNLDDDDVDLLQIDVQERNC
jgi:hypothetical protein